MHKLTHAPDNVLEASQQHTGQNFFPRTPEEVKTCEEFQKHLGPVFIRKVWTIFRENNDNSEKSQIKGRKLVSRPKFIQIFNKKLGIDNTALITAIFERFKCLDEPDHIDIQDLVISFTILGRMSDEKKLRLIFDLTDVDEDQCLSIDDIHNMVRRIQRNFCREMTHIQVDSSQMLNELSLLAAERKFGMIVHALLTKSTTPGVAGEEVKPVDDNQDDNKFISWSEFHDCLMHIPILFKKFLPGNYLLSQVLHNRYAEKQYVLHTPDSIDDFDTFRKMIHFGLRNHYDEKDFLCYIDAQKGVPLPGKVTLPPVAQDVRVAGGASVAFTGSTSKHISDMEKFNKDFNQKRGQLVKQMHEMVKTEAQVRVDRSKKEEEKQHQIAKEANQTNNAKRHQDRVEEMRQFNQRPEYNENYFKKQLEQMRVKRSKFLSAEIESDKFFGKKSTQA